MNFHKISVPHAVKTALKGSLPDTLPIVHKGLQIARAIYLDDHYSFVVPADLSTRIVDETLTPALVYANQNGTGSFELYEGCDLTGILLVEPAPSLPRRQSVDDGYDEDFLEL